MLGGGLYAGKKQKIFFDLGCIVGSVDRLNKVNHINEQFNELVVSKTTTNIYFSLNYLFGL